MRGKGNRVVVYDLISHGRHSRESGNPSSPLHQKATWIPAFAGMTAMGFTQRWSGEWMNTYA
jgi:hypothetical protein